MPDRRACLRRQRTGPRTSAALGFTAGQTALVHVFNAAGKGKLQQAGLDPDALIEAARIDAGQRLSAFLATHPFDGVRLADPILREGRAAHEIVAAAEKRKAQLIVIGTRGLSGIRRAVLGSVAASVLRDATCDVLAIPPGTRR